MRLQPGPALRNRSSRSPTTPDPHFHFGSISGSNFHLILVYAKMQLSCARRCFSMVGLFFLFLVEWPYKISNWTARFRARIQASSTEICAHTHIPSYLKLK